MMPMLSFGLVLLCSCKPHAAKQSTDDDIPQVIRAEIDAAEKEVLKALTEGDSLALKRYLVPSSALNLDDDFLEGAAKIMAKGQPVLFHRHLLDVKGTFNSALPSGTTPEYSIQYQNATGAVVGSLYESRDAAIGLGWIKDAEKWRLAQLHVGGQTNADKTVDEWLDQAEDLLTQGKYVPAAVSAHCVEGLTRPVPWVTWKDRQTRYVTLSKRIHEKLKATISMPVTIKEVTGQPEIIYVECGAGSARFKYVTKIPLDEKDKIKREAYSIYEHIEKYFPHATETSKVVIFSAFSEAPTDAKKVYDLYGVIVDPSKPLEAVAIPE